MATVHVVMEEELLRAVDTAAKRAGVSRSTLLRKALREYLKGLKVRDLEARDLCGYQEHPMDAAEVAGRERVAAWPDR